MQLDHHLYPLADIKKTQESLRGSNQKGILIVLGADGEAHLPFLGKIITAAKLDMDRDAAVLVLEGKGMLNAMALAERTDSKKLLVFGVEGKRLCLNLNLPRYQTTHLSDRDIIVADSLSKIQGDQRHKRALWEAMKTLFDLEG